MNTIEVVTLQDDDKEDIPSVQLTLPYGGEKGVHLITKLKKYIKSILDNKAKPRIAYNATKLSSKFNVKDTTTHYHNIVYKCVCPAENCDESYIGETERRITERIMDHNKRDKKSHVLSHSREESHPHVWIKDFKILGRNYKNNIKRKISESLYIKEQKPTLNKQEMSFPLKLFN